MGKPNSEPHSLKTPVFNVNVHSQNKRGWFRIFGPVVPVLDRSAAEVHCQNANRPAHHAWRTADVQGRGRSQLRPGNRTLLTAPSQEGSRENEKLWSRDEHGFKKVIMISHWSPNKLWTSLNSNGLTTFQCICPDLLPLPRVPLQLHPFAKVEEGCGREQNCPFCLRVQSHWQTRQLNKNIAPGLNFLFGHALGMCKEQKVSKSGISRFPLKIEQRTFQVADKSRTNNIRSYSRIPALHWMPRWKNQIVAFAGEPGKRGGSERWHFINKAHGSKATCKQNMNKKQPFSPFTGVVQVYLPKQMV